jgi:sigma-B regulation protein RsbU (phosphoserine phosphatase)
MKFFPEDGLLKIIAAKGLPKDVMTTAKVKVGEGISGKVFKSAKPILIKNIKTTGFETKKRYRSGSLMSAPVRCFAMKVGKKPVGVINVTDRKGGRPFTAEDLRLLTTIANQTAAYLHLCDMADEAKRSQIVRRELELAREIQQRLLPQKMPKIGGYDVFGKCLTADKVGGDYFDFIIGGARPPSVVVADVAGHSVGAAITMSSFRSAIRSDNASSVFSPSMMAERLNTILYDDLVAAEQFISMVYLQLMPGVIKYTTAGHHPPVVFSGNGFINHSTEDVLLGVERYADFHDKRIELKKGDVVVLYTDGLIETKDASGRRFGQERLKEIVRAARGSSAKAVAESLCDAVTGFSGKRGLSDDVTVVAIVAK